MPQSFRPPASIQTGLQRIILLLFSGWCGAAAIGAEAGTPAKPEFSHPHGFYDAPFPLAITSAPGTSIRFTLNGDRPTPESGTLYSGPIPVRTTTILRGIALAHSTHATNVSAEVTQTFLFLRDVVQQTGTGFPASWGTNQGRLVPADYAMDPDITGHPAYRDQMLPALRALPALSLVLDPGDLWDPERGIYANPRETGSNWERSASLELIPRDGVDGFQANAGLRIQGGWNRRPEESPKHSFRVVFKKKYGPGKLRVPIFGPDGITEFDELILRSGCNNSWLHWSGIERARGELIRDQWMRETYAVMGHPSARGLFVHLFINGLYWGVYNPVERPDGSFVSGHFGGRPEHYDVRNADNILEGDEGAWRQLMAAVNAGVQDPAKAAALAKLIDLPAFADYMILNFYGANADWDRASNWYAARRRKPPGPFHFFIWDGERTLEQVGDNSMAADDDQSPTRLFHKLRQNGAFRRLFGERARQHLTGTGALTPEAAIGRYRRWSSQLEQAVIAESARWGDYRRDVHPYKTGPYELYTRDDHWAPEVKRLLTDYFPRRTSAVIQQFRKEGLFFGE